MTPMLAEAHRAHIQRRVRLDGGPRRTLPILRLTPPTVPVLPTPPAPAADEIVPIPAPTPPAVTDESIFGPIVIRRRKPRVYRMSFDRVIRIAADHFGESVGDVKGPGRYARYVKPRQVAVYILRSVLNRSYPQIAAALSRDHTTAMSSFRRIGERILCDADLAWDVATVEALVVAEKEKWSA